MSAVESFEQFIGNEIIEYLVNESRRYALFLNRLDPKISCDLYVYCNEIVVSMQFCFLVSITTCLPR